MKKLIQLSFIAVIGVFLSGCYAEPTQTDLERVKSQFLVMRFHAPFSDEWKSLSDKELFELSCKNYRVKCDEVMNLLKKQDENFYGKLMKNN